MSEMAHSEMAHEPTSNLCPSCAEAGIECIAPKKVPKITVSSLVKPEYRKDIPSEPFFFCQQKECGMVYFGGARGQIRKDQLSVGVWQKEDPGETPVCYCFDFSAEDIMEDARRNSPPTVPAIIRDKIKAGLCSCDTKNPQGICCLGNIAYWIKQA